MIILEKGKGSGLLLIFWADENSEHASRERIVATLILRMAKAGWIAKDWARVYRLTAAGRGIA